MTDNEHSTTERLLARGFLFFLVALLVLTPTLELGAAQDNVENEKKEKQATPDENHGEQNGDRKKRSKRSSRKVANRGFFWRVRSDTATVYLFGSIHVAEPSMYPLHPTVLRSYEASDALVVEIDITKIDPQEVMKLMGQKGHYPAAETVKSHVSGKTFKRFESFLKERNLPVAQVSKMRPWLIDSMLTLQELGKLGYDAELGIDKYFLDKAHKEKK